MTALRIFVSYTITESVFAEQLIADLQTAGGEVVTANDSLSDSAVMPFLNQELAQCRWLIVVQSPAAWCSRRIQAAASTALTLATQGQMGVLSIIMPSSSEQGEMERWTPPKSTILFNRDYPRVRDKVLLEVGLINLHTLSEEPPDGTFPPLAGTPPPALKRKGIASSGEKYADPVFPPGDLATPPPPVSKKGAFSQGRQAYRWLLAIFVLAVVLILLFNTIAPRTTSAIQTPQATRTVTAPREVPTAGTTPTSTPTVTPQQAILAQATRGQPFIDDHLQTPNGNKWFTDADKSNAWRCAFRDGTYHVSVFPLPQPSPRATCPEQAYRFDNVAYQVDMRLLQGDVGGMTFRAQERNAYYWFSLDAQGCYELYLEPSKGAEPKDLLPHRTCPHVDMHGTKQLTVVVLGSDIYLYIDGQYVNHTLDSTLPAGEIGVMCIGRQHATDVAFSSAKIWKLP